MFSAGDIQHDMEALIQQVSIIVDEFGPNGGATIKDSLNRIELRQVLQDRRQKALMLDMPIGVFETDDEGEVVWVNRKYLRMTGCALDEVKGSGWIDSVALEDRDRVVQEWNLAIDTEREFESDFMLITPDKEGVQVTARTYKMDEGYLGMLTPLD